MTRYRLPEALGGGEHEAYGFDFAASGTVSFIGEGWSLEVARDQLSKVALPPEPPVGSVVLDNEGDAWQLTPLGWVIASASRGGYETSAALQRYGLAELTPLVPDPFGEPVELPWVREAKAFGEELRVEFSHQDYAGDAAIYAAGGHMTCSEARDMARALWTAANQAEAGA
jgi:hypothetical protein